MHLILSLETSTDVCSVALHDGKELLASAQVREPQAHAARLAPLIDEVLAKAPATMKNIRAVAITSGPGSYTGLRIGTSTAKGLCYALDIPLIAVGSLELLAFQGTRHNASNALLCPMIDARRMEVYCMVTDPQLRIVEPVAPMVIDGNSFSELLQQDRMLFFGNGAAKCRAVITHANASFVADIYPNAADLGLMADEKYRSGNFEDVGAFKPFYLKEFAAKKPRGTL